MKLSLLQFNIAPANKQFASLNLNRNVAPSSNLERTPACDTISFRSVPNGELLRKLLPYGIPDMYSGVRMLDYAEFQKILRRRIFSSPIKNVTKVMSQYQDCFFPVEKDIFSIIKSAAKVFPNKKIAEVLHELVPLHQKRLRELQRPIFEKVTELAQGMPEEERKKFQLLMDFTHQKLTNIPVVEEFSAKEFQYKLKRIATGIEKRGNVQEIATINKLKKMSSHFAFHDEAREFEIRSRRKHLKNNKREMVVQNYARRQAENLRQMEKVLNHSPLARDKELYDLFSSSRARIYKIPVVSAFNRKSFIYELKKIADNLEDTKLAHKLIQAALKLPTSKEDISAFIMKCADYSSEKIGYEMLEGSLGSVDHLTPARSGGENCLSNYALASHRANSQRGHKTFAKLLEEKPEIYKNSQRYADRMIELYNDGIFSKIGLSRSYIMAYVSKVYKMSPPENRLVIDISKLKP